MIVRSPLRPLGRCRAVRFCGRTGSTLPAGRVACIFPPLLLTCPPGTWGTVQVQRNRNRVREVESERNRPDLRKQENGQYVSLIHV